MAKELNENTGFTVSIKTLIGIHNQEDHTFYDKLQLVDNFIRNSKNE